MFASSRDAAVRHATVAGLFQYTLGNFPIGSVSFLLDCNQSALEWNAEAMPHRKLQTK